MRRCRSRGSPLSRPRDGTQAAGRFALEQVELELDRHDRREPRGLATLDDPRKRVTRVCARRPAVEFVHRAEHLRRRSLEPGRDGAATRHRAAALVGIADVPDQAGALDVLAGDVEPEDRAGHVATVRVKSAASSSRAMFLPRPTPFASVMHELHGLDVGMRRRGTPRLRARGDAALERAGSSWMRRSLPAVLGRGPPLRARRRMIVTEPREQWQAPRLPVAAAWSTLATNAARLTLALRDVSLPHAEHVSRRRAGALRWPPCRTRRIAALLTSPDVRGLPRAGAGRRQQRAVRRPRASKAGRASRLLRRTRDRRDRRRRRRCASRPRYGWDAFVDWTLARGLLRPGEPRADPGTGRRCADPEHRRLRRRGRRIHRGRARVRPRRRPLPCVCPPRDCGFGYRDSVFKRELERRIVVAVEFQLPRDAATRLELCGAA